MTQLVTAEVAGHTQICYCSSCNTLDINSSGGQGRSLVECERKTTMQEENRRGNAGRSTFDESSYLPQEVPRGISKTLRRDWEGFGPKD